MKKTKALAALGAAAVLAAALTGCSQKAGGGTSPQQLTSSAGRPSARRSASTFSGGKAGSRPHPARRSPIGMINQEGGTVSDPEASAAVQAAFDYINKEQGGVGGHPLKLDRLQGHLLDRGGPAVRRSSS